MSTYSTKEQLVAFVRKWADDGIEVLDYPINRNVARLVVVLHDDQRDIVNRLDLLDDDMEAKVEREVMDYVDRRIEELELVQKDDIEEFIGEREVDDKISDALADYVEVRYHDELKQSVDDIEESLSKVNQEWKNFHSATFWMRLGWLIFGNRRQP